MKVYLGNITHFLSFSVAKAIEPNVSVLLALGAILQTKNESEAALNTYKKIRNIQDEGFEVWNNIGMCFYRKHKLIAVIFLVTDFHQILQFSLASSAGHLMPEKSFMALSS